MQFLNANNNSYKSLIYLLHKYLRFMQLQEAIPSVSLQNYFK